MPKIVDHQALRADLARRAIPVFQQHGYHGIGMRKIAAALGVPKSSLYHYFPTKQDLFMACTEALDLAPVDQEPDPAGALARLIAQLEENIGGELRLMVDYIGTRSREEVAEDPALRLYRGRLDATLEKLVGTERTPRVRVFVYGILMDRWLAGKRGKLDDIRPLLEDALGIASVRNSAIRTPMEM